MNLRALVNQYVEYYNLFCTEELVSMFTEDCLFQNMTNSAGVVECRGKEQLRQVTNQSKELFTERTQSIKNWIIDSFNVAIEIEFHAVMACDLPNGINKGDHLKLNGVSVFIFENGKIKRLTDYS